MVEMNSQLSCNLACYLALNTDFEVLGIAGKAI